MPKIIRIIAFLALTLACFAAGTVTLTEVAHRPLKLVKFAWTSDAGGAADGVTTEFYTGKIELLTTVPAAAGSAPTDNYDVIVTDSNIVNVLAGAGVDRDTANTEQVLGTSLGAVVESKLTLGVTNAGATKSGTVYLYIR